MNPIYLRLFDGYAADILQKADPFDSKSVDQLADSLSLSGDARLCLQDAFLARYPSGPPTPSPWDSTWAYPWSTTMSAVEAPSRSSSARGASSTWAPILPAEI